MKRELEGMLPVWPENFQEKFCIRALEAKTNARKAISRKFILEYTANTFRIQNFSRNFPGRSDYKLVVILFFSRVFVHCSSGLFIEETSNSCGITNDSIIILTEIMLLTLATQAIVLNVELLKKHLPCNVIIT